MPHFVPHIPSVVINWLPWLLISFTCLFVCIFSCITELCGFWCCSGFHLCPLRSLHHSTALTHQDDLLNVSGWTPVEHSGGIVPLHIIIHRLHLIMTRDQYRVVSGHGQEFEINIQNKPTD